MHSSEIAKVSFSTTTLRDGYDMEDVDDMLDRARDALLAWEGGQAGAMASEDVAACTFAVTNSRTGYDQADVDNFLDTLSVALKLYETGGRPTT
ncbi:DivIVA domain-containing protein [Arthrobacter livingstonensis]|nr:DivIVA domain-containing protein [Arthrobacter livingstonensis]